MLEKCCHESFEELSKKTSLVAFLLKSSNCPVTHLKLYGKLSPPQVFSLFVRRILEIARRASVMQKYFERQNKLSGMPPPTSQVQKIECEHYSKNILKLLNSIRN